MLDDTGIVRVLDPGVARLVDASDSSAGQSEPASPTQREHGHRRLPGSRAGRRRRLADHRADIYSLGCTIYYLLAGREPFPGETMRRPAYGPPRAPRAPAPRRTPRRLDGAGVGFPKDDRRAPARPTRLDDRGDRAAGGPREGGREAEGDDRRHRAAGPDRWTRPTQPRSRRRRRRAATGRWTPTAITSRLAHGGDRNSRSTARRWTCDRRFRFRRYLPR